MTTADVKQEMDKERARGGWVLVPCSEVATLRAAEATVGGLRAALEQIANYPDMFLSLAPALAMKHIARAALGYPPRK